MSDEWLLRWAVFHEPTKQLTVALRRPSDEKFEVHDLRPDGRGFYQLYEERPDGRRLVLEVDERIARELGKRYPPARSSFS